MQTVEACTCLGSLVVLRVALQDVSSGPLPFSKNGDFDARRTNDCREVKRPLSQRSSRSPGLKLLRGEGVEHDHARVRRAAQLLS